MTTCKGILPIYFANENSRHVLNGTVKKFPKPCDGVLTAIGGVEKADPRPQALFLYSSTPQSNTFVLAKTLRSKSKRHRMQSGESQM